MTNQNNSMIVPKSEFVTFEDDMIKHANLDMFQKTHVLPIHDNTLVLIQFEDMMQLESIDALLKCHSLSKATLIIFLKSIVHLKKLCDEHLLDFEKIDFKKENVLYDRQNNTFLWRYIPTVNRTVQTSLVDLLRHIIIESEHLSSSLTFKDLKLEMLNPEMVLEACSNPPKRSKDRFLKVLFQSKKSKLGLIKPSYSPNTIHKSRYAMLINKNEPSDHFKLYFEQNTIGRGEDCNLLIKHESVSRQHAMIYIDGHQYYIKDLNSKNGTFISNKQVHKATALVNGDIIQFGDKDFIFIS